jgi:hypothetical protein
MADELEKISASEKKKEDWMNSKWRPMMGWMYMGVCTCDFMLFPILWSVLQSISHGSVNTQWQPLTLQGAGLFHLAMGAVLGIAAYGRTQEKLNGANNGGLGAGTTYTPPAPITSGGLSNGGFSTPTSAPSTAVNPSPDWGTTPTAAPAASFGSSPSTGTSSFGSSNGFGDSPTQIKPIVRRPGT